ncbi:MAG: thioredoxin family protein [Gammaproteobacteria bacterium]|nr:thioredoxin family protein [Gammaproteobacteria bacterium]
MPSSPIVTLAITTSCPHCPSMMEVLSQLVKKGEIADLHIVNIGSNIEFSKQYEVRSVPWLRIGPFVLQGLHTQQEIQRWLTLSKTDAGITDYFTQLLTEGELNTVIQAIRFSPTIIQKLIPLIESDETNINVRLGLGAILEDLDGDPILESILDDLIRLLEHTNSRVRGDAAHFLSFIHSNSAITALEQIHDEADSEVKEIIAESLETLKDI